MMRYFLLIGCFLLTLPSLSQTFYQMQFTLYLRNKNVPVSALFVLNADDSGFVRIRYVDRDTKEDFIYQAVLSEEIVSSSDGKFNSDQVYYISHDPITWGESAIDLDMLPIFYFERKNEATIEPVSVYYDNRFGLRSKDAQSNFSYRYLQESDLTQKLLSRYFYEDEEWLTSFLQNNSKGFSISEKNMKIHLLLVSDTTDPKIGKSCVRNINTMENFYRGLAQYIGCPINIRKVMGPSYNKNNVLSEIKLLLPGSNDILIFFYSGHGYRKNSDPRRYPYFDLRANDSQDYLVETMNLEDVQNALQNKSARLTIVMSDCCNSYVDASNPIAANPVNKKSLNLAWDEKNVRSLFLDPARKTIMATASDSTQYAFMATDYGGLFSYSLNNALTSSVTKAVVSPTWFTILDATRNETFRLSRRSDCSAVLGAGARCYQIPAYRIR